MKLDVVFVPDSLKDTALALSCFQKHFMILLSSRY